MYCDVAEPCCTIIYSAVVVHIKSFDLFNVFVAAGLLIISFQHYFRIIFPALLYLISHLTVHSALHSFPEKKYIFKDRNEKKTNSKQKENSNFSFPLNCPNGKLALHERFVDLQKQHNQCSEILNLLLELAICNGVIDETGETFNIDTRLVLYQQ